MNPLRLEGHAPASRIRAGLFWVSVVIAFALGFTCGAMWSLINTLFLGR